MDLWGGRRHRIAAEEGWWSSSWAYLVACSFASTLTDREGVSIGLPEYVEMVDADRERLLMAK